MIYSTVVSYCKSILTYQRMNKTKVGTSIKKKEQKDSVYSEVFKHKPKKKKKL